ncbi:MAG: NFACT RNA binding domain-containing protein [Erysipelotrichia bacterium]|nr:NFACT RNA binding domain-containing protein [Erysipelotrichia bacterium]
MAFDGIFLHQVVKQLQPAVSERIVKIYQISDTEVLLMLKGHYSFQLMISTHSKYNRIHFTEKKYPTRSTPSNFIMLLRKYLEGGIITSLQQAGLDRYLIIKVNNRNEIGDRITLDLYVELMGKYANIILVQNDRIIDALKHIPPFENTVRTIQPGARFVVTAPQVGKVNPFEIEKLPETENPTSCLTGVSSLLADEILYRLSRQSFKEIMQEISNSDSLYLTNINDEQYFHCIALTHLKKDYQKMPICSGLDYVYFTKEEKERIRQITGDLFKFTRKEINKFTKKIDNLNNSLQEADNCEIYRDYGQLIYSNLSEIHKGQKQVTLLDFDNKEVTIPLNEKLDGKGNAKKFFTKYRKLSVSKKYINEQIAIAQDNLNYFTQILQQLEMSDFNSAEEIKQELINNGYLKASARKERIKKPKEPNYTKINFDDHLILLGKNNIQNDYISFKKANRTDYWFHVKDGSGSHVIINSATPTEKEIRACAMLAAYYSKYRSSSSIPVNYTQVKNLKKIPNSKLGKVAMKEYKTIYIDIDEKTIEQLLGH